MDSNKDIYENNDVYEYIDNIVYEYIDNIVQAYKDKDISEIKKYIRSFFIASKFFIKDEKTLNSIEEKVGDILYTLSDNSLTDEDKLFIVETKVLGDLVAIIRKMVDKFVNNQSRLDFF